MAEGEGNLSQQRAVSLLQEATRLIREYPGSSNDVPSAQVASPNVISQSESHATTYCHHLAALPSIHQIQKECWGILEIFLRRMGILVADV